jgi:hypothetical protein
MILSQKKLWPKKLAHQIHCKTVPGFNYHQTFNTSSLFLTFSRAEILETIQKVPSLSDSEKNRCQNPHIGDQTKIERKPHSNFPRCLTTTKTTRGDEGGNKARMRSKTPSTPTRIFEFCTGGGSAKRTGRHAAGRNSEPWLRGRCSSYCWDVSFGRYGGKRNLVRTIVCTFHLKILGF